MPQTGNSTQLTSSNPFGNLTSNWSFPQMNWSLASTSGGGDWLSNALGALSSLGSGMPLGVQGGSNSGSVEAPAYLSQNNRNKIFGGAGQQGLNPEMQARVIELIKRAHAKGIDFEISESFRSKKVADDRRKAAEDKQDGSERWYARGISQHTLGNAIDISRKTTSRENLDKIQYIWKYEMGNTIGMDFHDKDGRPIPEFWHCDGRKDISGKSRVTQWTSGRSSSYADGGYSSPSSSPWGGFSWSMPSFSSTMGGFGGGLGGSWINSMLGSSLGGWGGGYSGGGYSGGGSSTRALPSAYQDKVQYYSNLHGADARLISAMLDRESSGDPNATSRKGARGLMQLMPGTARELGVTNITDPDQNISGGTKYITKLIKRYNGDVRTGLAAYNCGPVEINNLVKRYGTTDYNVIGPHVNGDTQVYVRRVMKLYNSSGGGYLQT